MPQLTITRATTPAQFTVRVQQDPHDPHSSMRISCQVWAVDGSVLAAAAVTLEGLEIDYAESIITTAFDCYQWGAPQQQLTSMLRMKKREAARHAKAHGPVGRGPEAGGR